MTRGRPLVQRLRKFRDHGVHVLGSFIFGLPSDRPATFAATADVAERAGVAFAQFVMLTPYPGTVDFEAWEKRIGVDGAQVAGIPIHSALADPASTATEGLCAASGHDADEIRARTQAVWDRFYSLRRIWVRSRCTPTLRARLAFVLDLEALSSDVREYRHRHRQRAGQSGQPLGAPDCPPLPPAICRAPTPRIAWNSCRSLSDSVRSNIAMWRAAPHIRRVTC
jgi:hypothetical protein